MAFLGATLSKFIYLQASNAKGIYSELPEHRPHPGPSLFTSSGLISGCLSSLASLCTCWRGWDSPWHWWPLDLVERTLVEGVTLSLGRYRVDSSPKQKRRKSSGKTQYPEWDRYGYCFLISIHPFSYTNRNILINSGWQRTLILLEQQVAVLHSSGQWALSRNLMGIERREFWESAGFPYKKKQMKLVLSLIPHSPTSHSECRHDGWSCGSHPSTTRKRPRES